VIAPEERIDDDVLAIGGSVAVFGDIRGDLLAIGERVLVGGTISEDVLAAGQSMESGAILAGDLRALAGEMVLGGAIARNALAVAGSLRQIDGAALGGGGAIAAGTLHLDGDVGGRLQVDARELTLGESAAAPALSGTTREAPDPPRSGRAGAIAMTIRGPDWRDDLVGFARTVLRAANLATAFMLVLGATTVGWRWPAAASWCRTTIVARPGSTLALGLLALLLGGALGAVLLVNLVGAVPGILLLAVAFLLGTAGWGIATFSVGDLLGRDAAGQPRLAATLRALGGGICRLLLGNVPVVGGALALLAVSAGAGARLLRLIARTGQVHSSP